MNKKIKILLTAACMWLSGGINAADKVADKPVEKNVDKAVGDAKPVSKPTDAPAVTTPKPTAVVAVTTVPKIDPEKPPVMPVKIPNWQPTEPSVDVKPVGMVLMNKGAGHDDLVIKSVSVCDQNNVWCVANDGKADAVYQLTAKGLEHKFDGVFVSAGKGIVSAINEQHEVFELAVGVGDKWKKIENLKLTKISRPNFHTGWGIFDDGKGVTTFFSYDEHTKKWNVVKNALGMPAKGVVDCSANAEDAVLVLNDKGELLKSDLQRMELHEKAKMAMKAGPKKHGKKMPVHGGGKHPAHKKAVHKSA